MGNIRYRQKAYQKALILYNEAILHLPDRYLYKGRVLENIGNVYYQLKKYSQAIIYYKKAVVHYKSHKAKKQLYTAKISLSTTYYKLGMTPIALEEMLSTTKYFKRNDSKQYYKSLSIIADIYRKSKNYRKSLECYREGLAMTNRPQDKFSFYNNIGSIYLEQKAYSKAQTSFLKALEIANSIQDTRIVNTIYNLGEVNKRLQKFNYAEGYFLQALDTASKYNDTRMIAIIANAYGDNLLKQGKLYEAKNQLRIAYKHLENIPSLQSRVLENHLIVSQLYTELNDYQKAYSFLKKILELKDSMYENQRVKMITQSQVIFETYQKEDSIKKLTYEKQIIELESSRQEAIIGRRNAYLILSIILEVITTESLSFCIFFSGYVSQLLLQKPIA